MGTATPDVRTYLDTSTAHVTPAELAAIKAGPFAARPHEYGAWVHVPSASDFRIEEEVGDEDRAEFPNVIALVAAAQELGVCWINLDADAQTIDTLPTFKR